MKNLKIKPIKNFHGSIEVASDKSISHRVAIFSLLSDKISCVNNYLHSEDCLCTLEAIKALGAKIERKKSRLYIIPPKSINEPKEAIQCGNSGTLMRILTGFLASKEGRFELIGDEYLSKRPMRRIIDPLNQMGADINATNNQHAPLIINGKKLTGFSYHSPIASAQVKTAMILAALQADGVSYYQEDELSRNHTEILLKSMGAKIKKKEGKLEIHPQKKPLKPLQINIPNDPSSGFFFAVMVAILPNSSVLLKNMLLNKTRLRAYKVLEKMGLKIEYKLRDKSHEKIGDIKITHAELQAVKVDKKISHLIDEIPALAIAFAFAKGISEIRNAKELRAKESDRIYTTLTNLKACGVKVEEFEDGFKVYGGGMKKAKVQSFGDHRIAMSFIIAGLACGMEVEDVECINTSFKEFFPIIKKIQSSCK